MRKIAFTGTSCVGKTTLIVALEQYFANNPRVGVVHEAARQFFAERANLSETERFSSDVQGQLRAMVRANEANATKPGVDVLLCDNSPIAAVAFTHAAGHETAAAKMLNASLSHIQSYGKAYVLDPADVSYKTDSIRKETAAFRNQVHQSLIEMYHQLNIPYELLSGTVDQRLAKVLSELN